MNARRYTQAFKIEAVKQVTERGYEVAEVAKRLGITIHSRYAWLKRYVASTAFQLEELSRNAEIRRLRAKLKRVTEARDILKRAAA